MSECSVAYYVYLQVDLTNYEELCSVFELESVDAICHLASYGMSGREQLHKEVIWEVNVGGTNNIIKGEHEAQCLQSWSFFT